MGLYWNLIRIAFAFLAGAESANWEESSCAAARELDQQCDKHCYRIVKPLLEHARSVQWQADKFTELSNKIVSLEATIKTLEAQLEQSKEYRKYLIAKEDLVETLKTSLGFCQNETRKIAEISNAGIIKELGVQISESRAFYQNETRKMLEQMLNTTSTNVSNEEKIRLEIWSCANRTTGVYNLNGPGLNSFPVSCDSTLLPPGWRIIQRRINGSVSFERNLTEYEAGFGDPSGEFFVGLEKLHFLTTSKRHELYILLKRHKLEPVSMYYDNFVIGSKVEGFKLKSLGGFLGNFYDLLELSLNTKFTVLEGPLQGSKLRCVPEIGTGWWFKDYCHANLNANYEPNKGFHVFVDQIKFVKMMIRPKAD